MNNLTRVQKKNKTNKVAPFRVFAFAMKKEMEAKGIKIHSDKQMNEMASPRWAKLTEEQKARYKTEAKTFDPVVNKNRKLYNSLGQVIDEVEAEKKKQMEKKESENKEIHQMVEMANDLGDLDSQNFVFISTSSFYNGNEGIFPAELALAKFNLKDGLFDDIQIRINPGNLPLGSRADAQTASNLKHKFPLPPNCKGETNYMNILETILVFIKPMDRLPIFFTEETTRSGDKTLNETRKVMEKIFYESCEDDVLEELKVYPIEQLFLSLQRVTVQNKNRVNGTKDKPFSSIAYATHNFKLDRYEYNTKGCEFHNEEDANKNCCLSKVRRFGYTIAQWCTNGTRFPLKEGFHHPIGYQNDENSKAS